MNSPALFNQHKRQDGFTLLEVLMALSMISIAFIALGFAQINSARLTSSTRTLVQGKTEAEVQLGKLRQQMQVTGAKNVNPRNFKGFMEDCPVPTLPLTAVSTTANCGGRLTVTNTTAVYALTWVAGKAGTDPTNEGLVLVLIHVAWLNGANQRSYGLSAMVSCLDLIDSSNPDQEFCPAITTVTP